MFLFYSKKIMTQGFHHTSMRNHHQLFFHRDIPVKAAQILTKCVSTILPYILPNFVIIIIISVGCEPRTLLFVKQSTNAK